MTTTSYAILGLLDLRDWTAYELAQQANRSLAYAWPISESQLYAEPKRLAGEGLLTITQAAAGPERQRQVFAITSAGRATLRAWLASDPTPTRIQAEVMLRCLFATSGSAEDLRSAVDATRQSTLDAYLAGHEFVDEYLQGDNPFPERLHANLLWMALVRDLQLTIIDWADETLDRIATWEDSETGPGPDAVAELLQSLPRPGRARGLHE